MRAFLWACVVMLLAPEAKAEIDIQEVTSPGGISAWLVEDNAIPFVALELRFKGGASLDLPGKRGATYLMAGLLEEGTGDLDARGFALAVEELAADFEYDASDDSVAISAKFLTETTKPAIALLRRTIVEPSFNQSALDRVRAQVLSGIASDQKDPNTLAQHAFERATFGEHPYSMPLEGTEGSVTAFTREDMITAHKNALAKDRVFVSVVGDINAEELGVILDALLGDLPATGAPIPEEAPFNLEPGIRVLTFETPQSVAVFGHTGVERNSPDFLTAFVVNTIFGGGGFEARLMNEVRVKRGLTYGIYSYLMPKDYADLYMGRFSSANDRIAEAIAVIKEEWARIAEEGVSQEELDEAKIYLTGAYPLRFDGNARIANILVGMKMDNFGIDYVKTRNDQVRALTLEEVNRVAREMFRPEELAFFVVGQPVGLTETITQ